MLIQEKDFCNSDNFLEEEQKIFSTSFFLAIRNSGMKINLCFTICLTG